MRAKNSGARQRKKGTDGRNQHLQQANSSASSRSLSRDPVSTSDNVHDHDHDRSEDCVHDHGQDRGHNHGHDHHHHNEPNVFVVFMIFNVCVAAFMYAAYYLIQNPFFITSCNAEQPLVDIKDNFLSKEVFGELVECLHSHPLVVGNELDGKNFKGTRGFVIKFSEEGITDFRAHRYFACLAPYFDAVRFPRANAFVMNLLICEFASGNDDSNKNGLAVGTHLDNTIAIRSWRHFLAHQVNVLYAVVPKDMTGGDLHVFPFEGGRPEDNDPPVHSVVPRTNRMVAFKGNAYHRVMKFKTSTNVTRISIVVEQYQVPESYKPRLIRSTFERRNGIAMM